MLNQKELASSIFEKKRQYDSKISHEIKLFSVKNDFSCSSKRYLMKKLRSEKNAKRRCKSLISTMFLHPKRENPRNSNKKIGCCYCFPVLNSMLRKRKEKIQIIKNDIKFHYIFFQK